MDHFLTVKALGRVLLHLQCFGRLLQRKLGLSVWTRPLGGAMLHWWRRDFASWSSSWWLADDGAGRRFTTTGSERKRRHRDCFLLAFIFSLLILAISIFLTITHVANSLYTDLQHKLL